MFPFDDVIMNSRQKGSVDLEATVWFRNSIVLISLGPYHESIQLTLCATMLSPRRSHIANTALSFCRYRSLFAGTFSLTYQYRYQAIHGTVLFTPDLPTPHTAFSSLPAAVTVFWNVSTHFFCPCAHSDVASSKRCRLTRRKLNTYQETRPPSWENGIPGRYLLSYHTVKYGHLWSQYRSKYEHRCGAFVFNFIRIVRLFNNWR